MVRQEWLDELWDFDDPAASEQRFFEAAMIMQMQRARAMGLQGKYKAALGLLDRLNGPQDRAVLEMGRVYNTMGEREKAIRSFEVVAHASTDVFVRIDALHMLAIADPERAEQHTTAALTLLDGAEDDRTRRWAVALHNNLGWTHFDAGRFEQALGHFELALEAAELYGTDAQRQYAREAIDEAKRALGRTP